MYTSKKSKRLSELWQPDRVCFYGADSYFSNWNILPFHDNEGIGYKTIEHYIVYQKAILFGDLDVAERVLQSPNGRAAKAESKKIAGYDPAIWKDERYVIELSAVYHKFKSHSDALTHLMKTNDRLLVDCTDDTYWGSGVRLDDPSARTRKRWPGNNIGGRTLMDARDILAKEFPKRA